MIILARRQCCREILRPDQVGLHNGTGAAALGTPTRRFPALGVFAARAYVAVDNDVVLAAAAVFAMTPGAPARDLVLALILDDVVCTHGGPDAVLVRCIDLHAVVNER